MSLSDAVEDIHLQARDRNTVCLWLRKLARKDVFSRLAEAHIEHLQAVRLQR